MRAPPKAVRSSGDESPPVLACVAMVVSVVVVSPITNINQILTPPTTMTVMIIM